MPFAKSCKVTVEGAQQLYYQVNYWTWPPGTRVTTFTTGKAEEIGGGDWGDEYVSQVTIPPGEGRTVLQRTGPETIRRLLFNLAETSYATLRPLRLQPRPEPGREGSAPMLITNISEAESQLSVLVDKVMAGEEVIIGKEGKPVARLVRYEHPDADRKPGALKGQIKIADDFDRLPEDLAQAFGIISK
jgi:prevent-host-death family protein